MIKIKRIVWNGSQYCEFGFVDDIRLFTAGYDGIRARGSDSNTPYALHSSVPGFVGKFLVESMGSAKTQAKEILEKFVERLLEK